MFAYGIKMLYGEDIAAVLNENCLVIGFLDIKLAENLLSQKNHYNEFRWVSRCKDYTGVFSKKKGPAYWFDRKNPQHIPNRYNLDKAVIDIG